ncbi:MAG: hypothetical protein WC492_03290 [Candidatus Micrarchaeia archaeon]
MEEEKASANSELRYLALELTKLAKKEKKPFATVANQYVQNVFELEGILKSSSSIGMKAKAPATENIPIAEREKKGR